MSDPIVQITVEYPNGHRETYHGKGRLSVVNTTQPMEGVSKGKWPAIEYLQAQMTIDHSQVQLPPSSSEPQDLPEVPHD